MESKNEIDKLKEEIKGISTTVIGFAGILLTILTAAISTIPQNLDGSTALIKFLGSVAKNL
jgi:hypothetical protein